MNVRLAVAHLEHDALVDAEQDRHRCHVLVAVQHAAGAVEELGGLGHFRH
jgi:hypothetical protein